MFECGAIGNGACIKDLSGYVPDLGITKENIITKRNVFDASMIETLRAKDADNKGLENQKQPSSVETLSTFMDTLCCCKFTAPYTLGLLEHYHQLSQMCQMSNIGHI